MRSVLSLLPVLALALVGSGCAFLTGAGARLFTKTADADGLRIERGLAYRAGSAHPKHRLDVYVPRVTAQSTGPWPVVVFVHGGGWTTGDKDLSVGGFEPYHNLARLLAGQGIAVALVNYRLLDAGAEGAGRPASSVTPEAQVEDVASAVAWVRANAARYGADPNRLFVMGHSAGGQLAARVALDRRWLDAATRALGPGASAMASRAGVCGAILVSGAGLDLTDVPSIRGDYRYFAARFAPPAAAVPREMPAAAEAWQREASPASYVTAAAPPFRFFVASGEKRAFREQAERLRATLSAAGVETPAVGTFGAPAHAVGALTMSRPGRIVGRETAAFVKGTACPAD